MVRKTWVVDSETDPFKYKRVPKPFIWGAYDGQQYLEFADAKQLVDYFRDKEVIIYAHNGGKFDWHFILDELEPDIALKVISGRLAKFKIGKAEYRDSFSILPFKLEKYKKTKINYRWFEKNQRAKHMPKIRAYLRDDCVNLYELVSRFIDQFGAKLTLPGAAMAYWEKKHGADKATSSKFFYKQLEPFYYGGRVECFKKGHGKQKFKVYDINSAYPRAMCEDHPIGTFIATEKSIRPLTEAELCRSFITITCRSVGAFPFREANGSLTFPNDALERTFYVTGWEYIAARDLSLLDANCIVHSALTLDKTINFTPYIKEFFARKAAAKEQKTDDEKAEYIFAKLLQVALYGKYGANPGPGLRGKGTRYKEYETCRPDEVIHRAREGWKPIRREHNVTIITRDLPEEKWRFFNVGTAASITGYVRAMLLRGISGAKGLLYCDTDSIVCSSARLDTGQALGQWNNEGSYNEYAIAGKKLYAFFGPRKKPKIASKGAKLTANQIRKIAKGGKVRYNNQAPTFSLGGVSFVSREIKMT